MLRIRERVGDVCPLEDAYGAVDLVLDAEDEAFVNELIIPGHASTHNYTDPSCRFFGRPSR